MIITPSDTEFSGLMDSVEAFKDYLEQHDELEASVLIDLHRRITETLIELVSCQDGQDLDASERIRRETEAYLSTTVEFDALVDNEPAFPVNYRQLKQAACKSRS